MSTNFFRLKNTSDQNLRISLKAVVPGSVVTFREGHQPSTYVEGEAYQGFSLSTAAYNGFSIVCNYSRGSDNGYTYFDLKYINDTDVSHEDGTVMMGSTGDERRISSYALTQMGVGQYSAYVYNDDYDLEYTMLCNLLDDRTISLSGTYRTGSGYVQPNYDALVEDNNAQYVAAVPTDTRDPNPTFVMSQGKWGVMLGNDHTAPKATHVSWPVPMPEDEQYTATYGLALKGLNFGDLESIQEIYVTVERPENGWDLYDVGEQITNAIYEQTDGFIHPGNDGFYGVAINEEPGTFVEDYVRPLGGGGMAEAMMMSLSLDGSMEDGSMQDGSMQEPVDYGWTFFLTLRGHWVALNYGPDEEDPLNYKTLAPGFITVIPNHQFSEEITYDLGVNHDGNDPVHGEACQPFPIYTVGNGGDSMHYLYEKYSDGMDEGGPVFNPPPAE